MQIARICPKLPEGRPHEPANPGIPQAALVRRATLRGGPSVSILLRLIDVQRSQDYCQQHFDEREMKRVYGT